MKRETCECQKIRIFLTIIVVCSFIFMACDRVEANSENQDITEMILYVRGTGQGTFFNDLKIGVGNIWEEEYVDGNGESKKGITCG